MAKSAHPSHQTYAPDYTGYAHALKSLTSLAALGDLSRVIVLSGSSDFLRISALTSIRSKWSTFDASEPQNIEATGLDPSAFRGMWSQVSLFEPNMLYVLRRCDKHAKLASWLKDIKEAGHIKNHLVFEFGDKIPAELTRQLDRLGALVIPCVEPTSLQDCGRIAVQLAKREGLVLADDAVRLLLDSMGPDLAKLNNEIQKIGLVFHGRTTPLRSTDIAAIVGALREDHVFELFQVLRTRQRAKAQLLLDHLLERGEKAIALIGILSRFAREMVPRDSRRGMKALYLCSEADILLKSRRVGEAPLLGNILDALVDG